MLRLLLNDLVLNARIWIGALCVAAATAAAGSAAAGLIETGIGLGFLQAAALSVLGSALILFTIISAVVVLSSVTRLTVALQRRGYALWQLVGISSRTIVVIVRTQLVLVATLGASLGCLIAAPFVPAFLEFGLSDSEGLTDVTGRFSVAGAFWVVLSVVVIVWFSGLGASRRAGQVRAIEVLRDPTIGEARMTWVRWVVIVVTLAIAVSMTVSLGRGSLSDGGTQILLIGPMFTAAAAAAGPVLFPRALRTWTSIIPDSASPSWFLARNTADYDITRSSSTVSALLVSIALPGSLYTGFLTYGNAVNALTGVERGALAPQSFLLMLGGALLVSLVGAAATVYMAGRAREREAALVRSAGGTQGIVLSRATWEALMHVGTATIIAATVLVVTGIGQAWSLSTIAPGVLPGFGVAAAATAAGSGLAIILAASLLPALAASRKGITQVLAAE
jgi:putative ABC transport system permease protein